MNFLAASSNKRSDLLLCLDQNIITASESMVIVYDLEYNLKQILKGHSESINALGIMGNVIVSGGQDKTIRIWWENVFILNTTEAVVALHALSLDQVGWIVFSCADGSITILKIDTLKESVQEFQTIKLNSKFVLAMVLGVLPGSDVPFMVTGGSDNMSSFYILYDSHSFVKVTELKGHGDWIKSLDIMVFKGNNTLIKDGDVMLASASQDGFIRLFKISPLSNHGNNELNTKSHLICAQDKEYSITFHSLLTGHEDWVNSVRWLPKIQDVQPLSLVSASADKSVIIWSFDDESGVWFNKVRLGNVGGTTLGYYGALVLPGGKKLLAHGYHGALQCWDLVDDGWISVLGISGHELSVQDICWNPSGTYLLSTSLDQTTRLFAEWKRGDKKSWHEMARTQIHGYDLQVLAFINEYEYVSGADEKILRVFEANRNFVESLEGITQAKVKFNKEFLPVGASLPALGLSNKALYKEDLKKNADEKCSFAPGICRDVQFSPPLEADLLQNTLWPEKEKLYGHGFEIIAVGTSRDGKYIASSCKASKAEYAAVIIWSAESYRKIGELSGHALTVTTIVFSPDGKWLVTAGRDRSWILHQSTGDESNPFRFYASNAKAHSRIIWKCSWTFDSRFFATASRDKSLKIWSPSNPLAYVFDYLFDESVTCCDFAPYDIKNGEYILAVGLESGSISILYITLDDNILRLKLRKDVPIAITPAKAIKTVKWRPGQDVKDSFELAACSADHSVRIFTIF